LLSLSRSCHDAIAPRAAPHSRFLARPGGAVKRPGIAAQKVAC
jgi:hypothetical protein